MTRIVLNYRLEKLCTWEMSELKVAEKRNNFSDQPLRMKNRRRLRRNFLRHRKNFPSSSCAHDPRWRKFFRWKSLQNKHKRMGNVLRLHVVVVNMWPRLFLEIWNHRVEGTLEGKKSCRVNHLGWAFFANVVFVSPISWIMERERREFYENILDDKRRSTRYREKKIH